MMISVVIPTCQRKDKLNNCLESLLRQTYPHEQFEIIVVDDRAENDVKMLVEDYKQRHSSLQYIAQNSQGPAAARNKGVKNSVGGIVAFLDDDCIADPEWVRLMVQMHESYPNAVAIGGSTVSSAQKTTMLVSQFLSTLSIETTIDGKKEVIFFPTCNVSFKRYIFDYFVFDEHFPLPGGEDLEFFWRLYKGGYRFIYDTRLKVIHCRDDRFLSFIKQAYSYGRGNLLVQYIHRDHPLLKELQPEGFSFWKGTFLNTIKIIRFSYLLGKRLISEEGIYSLSARLAIYIYFIIHKIFYISGNIYEFFRVKKELCNVSFAHFNIPKLIILDITHSCNLSCRVCDIWKTKDKQQEMSQEYIKKILLQSYTLGIKEIALSGGEALMRTDICEILGYAKQLGIKNLGLLSNGILVEKKIDVLQPYLFDNTISLVISFDSLTPDIHNYIRNSDVAWQKTNESLKRLAVLKKTFPQINFNIITIVLNQNLEELFDLAQFIKSLGASSLQFQGLLPNNLIMNERKKSFFWVTDERLSILDETMDRLINFKKDNKEFVRNSEQNLLMLKKYYRGNLGPFDTQCFSADKTFLISVNGEYRTCFSAYGNVKNQTLNDVLASKDVLRARTGVKKCLWPCLLPCFCD